MTISHNGAVSTPSGGGVIGPEFRLLLLSDTTNGDTTFTDSSPDARSIAVVGDSKHVTTYGSPFAGISSSMYFDGDCDRLEVTIPSIASMGAFTIDCYVKRPTDTLGTIFGIAGDTYNYALLGLLNLNETLVGELTDSAVSSAASYTHNTWIHYALSWNSANLYLFGNGKYEATISASGNNFSDLLIGAYKTFGGTIIDYPIAISNFAIRDECVWSGSGYSIGDQVFTPPTTPYGS